MKKKLLRLAVVSGMLITMSATVNAQWTQVGTSTYLTSTGNNVGIGTTTPGFKLDVQSTGIATMQFKSTTDNASILLDRGASNKTSSLTYRSQGTNVWQTGIISNTNYQIRNNTLAAPALTILASNSYVGIGTGATGPLVKFHVKDTTSNVDVKITGNASEILFRTYDSNVSWPVNLRGGVGLFNNVGNGNLNIGTAGTGKVNIYSNNNFNNPTVSVADGLVGIGTTSPTSKLHMAVSALAGDFFTIQNTNAGGGEATIRFSSAGSWEGFMGLNAWNVPGSSKLGIGNGGAPAITVDLPTNNVGIGTTNPQDKLHVVGSFRISNSISAPNGFVFEQNANGHLNISYKNPTSVFSNLMTMNYTGEVGIGTTTTATGYKLTVAGKVICTELKVQLQPFPDYVFAKDYNLKSIEEVEQHINTYNRLPGMPSACEVEENGMSVGEMQGKVVEKVEENTLYIIQLNKKIEAQDQLIKAMQAQLDALKK